MLCVGWNARAKRGNYYGEKKRFTSVTVHGGNRSEYKRHQMFCRRNEGFAFNKTDEASELNSTGRHFQVGHKMIRLLEGFWSA